MESSAFLLSSEADVQRCSVKKKDYLRNSAKFTGKHLCQSLIFNKVAGLNTSGGLLLFRTRVCNLLNADIQRISALCYFY